jgi:hypothetical protein
MKKYKISFFTIILLLIVNTSYFWENLPGLFDMTILFLTLIGFIILIIVFINQLIKGITEKFKNRIRVLNLLILSTVLALTYLHPFGFINFEKIIYGEDIYFTQYEGAASGTISLKLKNNNKFIEKSVFWGVENYKGNYKIKNDTLFLIYNSKSNFNEKTSFCIEDIKFKDHLLYYRNTKDTIPLRMKTLKGNFSILK